MEHMKCNGAGMLILGALILANVYLMKLTWGTFIGGLFVLGGLTKIIMHGCCKKKKKK